MKTRFDDNVKWRTSPGEFVFIADMDTSHILNVIRMFIQKPYLITSMIVKDIEENTSYGPVEWTPNSCAVNSAKKQSINNITSMAEDDTIRYALESPLGQRFMYELAERGVNIENMRSIWEKEIHYRRSGN